MKYNIIEIIYCFFGGLDSRLPVSAVYPVYQVSNSVLVSDSILSNKTV
jgi:hypothetical protein